jgi:hypothetical protein
MIVLTVYREWESAYNQRTILKDSNGKIKAIISSSLRQPKKNQSSIVINCNTFLLDWSNVGSNYVKVKDRIINN